MLDNIQLEFKMTTSTGSIIEIYSYKFLHIDNPQ